jgi:hypothetical protein
LSACKKENNNVGIDIQPPNDRLGVEKTDTVTVISYSQRIDSVRTDETSVSLLGSLNDPIFGTKTANIYTQFRLSQVAGTFGDNPVLDSLILTLDFASIYGDSTATLTLDIFEMSEGIHADSNYYSDNSTAYYPELIASKTFTANLVDSVVVNGDTLPPHLRINLGEANPAFAEKLLSASPDDLNTQDNFVEFFKGLYLKVQEVSSGGAILSVDLLSSLSEMVLYYRNDEEDSLDFNFAISSFAARYGQFQHNYSVAQPIFRQQVIEGDTSLGKTTCYVQSMAGVKTIIKFPFLRSLNLDGNIAVNEARLFINVQEEDPWFPPAQTMVLVRSDGEGGYTVLEDQLEGQEYFGGVYDEENRGYWFRITSSIQQILSQDDPDHGFELFISGGSLNAQRCVLTGSDPITPVPYEERMRLVITYSKIL